ncbi:MAG: VOC family protein, partial [Nitrospinota bacterium]
ESKTVTREKDLVHGSVVWHDLITTQIDDSLRFYQTLFGWNYITKNLGDYGEYHQIAGKEAPIGGFLKPLIPDVPSHWSLYVSVPDLKESIARVKKMNGRVIIGPLDIPDLGSFAVTLDPEGAAINLFSSFKSKEGAQAGMAHKPKTGEFCWNECVVEDESAEKNYYSGLFSWKFRGMNASKGLPYWVAMKGEKEVAGLLQKPKNAPAPPHWLTYVLVEDLHEALSKVPQLGGKILVEPIQVSGIGTTAIIQDLAGAIIGLFSSTSKKHTG